MADESSNDNNTELPSASSQRPDAHGEAALLLVESLTHTLIEREIITVADAVEIVEIAIDVASDAEAEPFRAKKTVGLLETICISLRNDL